MSHSTTARPGRLVRARRALKAAAYSGLRRDRWQHPRAVLDALGVGEGTRVADVGAGGGYFTFRAAETVGPTGRVYAVDADDDMRSFVEDRAVERGLSNIVTVAAGEDDPRLPEPVDVAMIVDAFHHLPEPGPYLQALAARLAPGGRVAVIEPVPRWWLFGHATDPAQVRGTLERAGYEVTTHEFLPRQAFLVGTRPS